MRITDKRTFLITGATGLVGSNLILELLRKDPDLEIIALVRGGSDWEAGRRLRAVLDGIGCSGIPHHRVRALCGDVTKERLGLDEDSYRRLALEITHIIHGAATVQFNLPLECAREVNLGGTKNIAALARIARMNGRLERLSYVSTAFVAGDRTGNIYEAELDCGQAFSNSYERTKYEAESFLRENSRDIPITIFRPSIIVGDSRTGRTTAFNVLYAPLRLIQKGMLHTLPGFANTALDIVPVDFVGQAIAHVALSESEKQIATYHVTAGVGLSPTAGEIVRLAVDYFNAHSDGQRIGPTGFYSGMFPMQLWDARPQEKIMRMASAVGEYTPYLTLEKDFDNSVLIAALQGSGIVVPRFRDYCEVLLAFCLQSNWGKHLPAAA